MGIRTFFLWRSSVRFLANNRCSVNHNARYNWIQACFLSRGGSGCREGRQHTWLRHQMETFSALLALCAGNSTVTGEFPHKGQWRGTLMFSLIWAWINGLVNNREARDLRRYRAHHNVNVMENLTSGDTHSKQIIARCWENVKLRYSVNTSIRIYIYSRQLTLTKIQHKQYTKSHNLNTSVSCSTYMHMFTWCTHICYKS